MLDSAVFRFEMDPRLVPQIGGKERNTTRTSKKEDDTTSYNGISLEETKQSEASTQIWKDNPPKLEDHIGPIVKVVNEAQFINMMEEKATSRQWRALECIQTCVKSRRGLGKHIPVNFEMQIDYNDQLVLQKAVKSNDTKFLKGKRLALEYDYNAIGKEYRDQIVEEH